MKQKIHPSILILFFSLLLICSTQSFGAGNTSVGINGSLGLPLGWWGERWNPSLNSDINLRFEFQPGTGILLFTGLGKSYFTELSAPEIVDESNLDELGDAFSQYTTIIEANQTGSFTQIPIGCGFFMERLIRLSPNGSSGQIRGYGTIAMSVYLWSAERAQNLTYETNAPRKQPLEFTQNWSDKIDGSDLGAQIGLGLLYQLNKSLFLDLSVVYNYLEVGKSNNAVIYYGKPARTWDERSEKESNSRTDFLQFRIGFKYGLNFSS